MGQHKQVEWLEQWTAFQDDELFLFKDWISPNRLEDFKDKSVLEAGCGGGQHTSFVAPICRRIVAVDLNSIAVASQRNNDSQNTIFIEDDISEMSLGETFDVVFSIGVVHHTDDPDRTVKNLIKHLKVGGRLILWVYSKEGNWIAENIVERARRAFFSRLGSKRLITLSRILTALMYVPIYTIYLFPVGFLPYYEYFQNFRRLSFDRNTLNVFDKLNAPQVQFISEDRIRSWFDGVNFTDVHVARYKGVSWQASATLSKSTLISDGDP